MFFFSFVGLLDTWVVATDYDCVTNIHIAQTHLLVRFYYFQIDFAYMADRRIDATDPLDLNSWLVLLMQKSELVLAHALGFYWLVRLYITGSLCFCLVCKRRLISFFVRLDHQFCPFNLCTS